MPDEQLLAEPDGGTLYEAVGEVAKLARGLISEDQRAVDILPEVKMRARAAAVELADLGMDDAVDARDEIMCRLLPVEEAGISRGEPGQRIPAEPAQYVFGGLLHCRRRGLDERRKMIVRIASERGVGALQPGCVEQFVPALRPK